MTGHLAAARGAEPAEVRAWGTRPSPVAPVPRRPPPSPSLHQRLTAPAALPHCPCCSPAGRVGPAGRSPWRSDAPKPSSPLTLRARPPPPASRAPQQSSCGATSSQREDTQRQLAWLGGVRRCRCRGVPPPPCPLPRATGRSWPWKSQHTPGDLSRRSKIRLLNSSPKSYSMSLRLLQGGFCQPPGGRDFRSPWARGGGRQQRSPAQPRGQAAAGVRACHPAGRAPALQMVRLRHREAPRSREGQRR